MNLNNSNKKNLNILIPMAGAGSRFEQAGYSSPKPLIDVNGQPMIKIVVDNLNLNGNYIFIVQKSHREKYNLDSLLTSISPNCTIVETEGLTEGAACTALLAKKYINNEDHLIICNSDQWIDWNSDDFLNFVLSEDLDGSVLTFYSNSNKHSYAKSKDGLVVEFAEKEVISDDATVGLYYWKSGRDFVECAESMIKKNIRTNNEFYICPVYNQLIENNGKIKTYKVSEMLGMGTPDELNNFLKHNKI